MSLYSLEENGHYMY